MCKQRLHGDFDTWNDRIVTLELRGNKHRNDMKYMMLPGNENFAYPVSVYASIHLKLSMPIQAWLINQAAIESLHLLETIQWSLKVFKYLTLTYEWSCIKSASQISHEKYPWQQKLQARCEISKISIEIK